MTGPGTVLDRGAKPAPVDPRLRARRIEVRRREGRKRLRRLLALLGFTLLVAASWGLSRSPLFDVDHIEVSGVTRAQVDDVIAASGIDIGDALVDVDLAQAREGVAGLGWIESVEATRSWGGTIRVRVTERRPVAVLMAADGSHRLVDGSGFMIDEATATDIATLPIIEGLDLPASDRLLEGLHRRAVQVAAGMTSGLAPWVRAIVLEADSELWIDLVAPPGSEFALDGARARLGDGRDLRAQLIAVETVLTRVQLDCLAVVDARVGTAPVVTRHDDCEGIS